MLAVASELVVVVGAVVQTFVGLFIVWWIAYRRFAKKVENVLKNLEGTGGKVSIEMSPTKFAFTVELPQPRNELDSGEQRLIVTR